MSKYQFRWFYFRSQYISMVLFSKLVLYFKVFEAVLHELFERDDITKLSTVEQHCSHCCPVMLTHLCSSIFVTARNSQSILASRASKINFNKTVCLLMALAIDRVVLGCCIYKDVWSAEMDSCSAGSAIAKAGMPLHTHTLIH